MDNQGLEWAGTGAGARVQAPFYVWRQWQEDFLIYFK